MKTWIFSFFILLTLFEGYQWIQHWVLPWPLLVGCSALLALIANANFWLPVGGHQSSSADSLPPNEQQPRL